MLVINDDRFIHRAEIIWEKGTNRAAFWRGEVDKYGWVDVGSSFLPSEIIAAFLWAQLENLEDIQAVRLALWNRYYKGLETLAQKGAFRLPEILPWATNNAHMFYLIFESFEHKNNFIQHMKSYGIHVVFHYQSLHKSYYYNQKHDNRNLCQSDRFTDTLVRLPMYYELNPDSVLLGCFSYSDVLYG